MGDVSSWRFFFSVRYKNFFCKKKKKIEIGSQFDLFINVLAMPCVTIQGDLLLLDWCYTQCGKICSVMWCAVQYSQHLTSITVLSSTYFTLKPFCNTDMTYSIEIFHVFFKTPPI